MNRYDIEKSMERSRRMFAILRGVVIAFILLFTIFGIGATVLEQ